MQIIVVFMPVTHAKKEYIHVAYLCADVLFKGGMSKGERQVDMVIKSEVQLD